MEKRIFKDKAYIMLANMIKAMANPRRLEIIDLLGQGEKMVEDIANETNISVANASQHLQMLKANHLVDIRRQGNHIFYRLINEKIYQSWKTLRDLGTSHLAEVEKLIKDFREQRSSLQAVSVDELVTRMKSKNIVLLDVRPESEYNNGHLPGAIHISPDELLLKAKRLSKNKEYVAYCRGPLCVFADEAVHLLTNHGFKVRRLQEGFPDWKVKGLPVEYTIEK